MNRYLFFAKLHIINSRMNRAMLHNTPETMQEHETLSREYLEVMAEYRLLKSAGKLETPPREKQGE